MNKLALLLISLIALSSQAQDLWLCSGQRNKELPVRRVLDMFSDEVLDYENPYIEQFIVPKEFSFEGPQESLNGGTWLPCTQANVQNFSALAYFFCRSMYARTGRPQRVVNASWGGTPIEAWISPQAFQDTNNQWCLNDCKLYANEGYRDRVKALEGENYHRWNTTLWQSDPGMQSEVKWFEPNADDSEWSIVDISKLSREQYLLSNISDEVQSSAGSHWFRRDFVYDSDSEAVLRLGCLVDADSVWVNGVFVGNTTYMYPPRIYNVPAGVLHKGVNNITVRIVTNSGEPQFVPEKPYLIAPGGWQVADGTGSTISLLGEWRYKQGAVMPSAPSMMFWCYKPTVLYNQMIAPLKDMKFKGVIWYQGESNVSNRAQYADYLKLMIADWRRTFNDPELPFYIVELADHLPFDDLEGRAAWAEMRAQQAKAVAETPNAYLIKNSDLGEWNDIHPLDKKSVAERVADAAMTASY